MDEHHNFIIPEIIKHLAGQGLGRAQASHPSPDLSCVPQGGNTVSSNDGHSAFTDRKGPQSARAFLTAPLLARSLLPANGHVCKAS